LTAVYLIAAGLGIWGMWLAIKGIWHAEDWRLEDTGQGVAHEVNESYELPRFRDLWRRRARRDFWQRRAKVSHWRRTATDAQFVIGAGVFLGAVGNIVSLWWV
jgi:hypothetical protein